MEQAKIPPHIRTSNPQLARWQSAVAAVVRKRIIAANEGSSITSINQQVLYDSMVLGTNLHVSRHNRKEKPLLPEDIQHLLPAAGDTSTPVHPLVHSYLSQQFFNAARAAKAKTDGDFNWPLAEFPFSDYAYIEWGAAATNWNLYEDSSTDAVAYIDWEVNKEDIDTFSVITIPENSKIVILGDFGTGLPDAANMLMGLLQVHNPDFIIHVGDIYYSGTSAECTNNYTQMFTEAFAALNMAPIPVFSLPGNHEYMTMAMGYFSEVIPMNANNGIASGYQQQASYFCLRTTDNNWQFLGMDTGLYSVMGNTSTDLTDMVYAPWLRFSETQWHINKLQKFASLNPSGKTILLSHHQLYSASSVINNTTELTYQPGTNPGELTYLNKNLLNVFSPYFNQVSAWFWGHEHIFGIFEDNQLGLAKGRLIGSSGYEEWQGESPYDTNAGACNYSESPPIEAGTSTFTYQSPFENNPSSFNFYNHSYAVIQLNGSAATVNYYQCPFAPLPPSVLISAYDVQDNL